MNHTPPRLAGFTLIEGLIVMALLAVFLTALTTLLTSTVTVQNRSAGYSAVSADGRFIMTRLDYDISRASAVSTPAALGASSTSLVMTITGTTYTYALSGSNLQLTDGVGSANLNGNRAAISGLSFQELGNSGGKESIRYTFTIASTVKDASLTGTQTFTSTVERR